MPDPDKRNFHLPLPDRLYQRLRSEARRSGTPATRLVREALEKYLRDRERQAVHKAVVEYATSMAGSGADLDEDLQEASLESLWQVVKDDEWEEDR